MKRIERVEHALRRDPLVHACAVVRGPGSSTVAFLVTAHESAEGLHHQLKASVPLDLLPRAYISMAQLPVLPGGEIDVARLIEISACDPQVVWVEQVAKDGVERPPVSIERMALRRVWSPALHDAVFQTEISVLRSEDLGGGRAGASIDVGSYLLAAAIEAAGTVPTARPCILEDVTFDTALLLKPGERRVLQVVLSLGELGEIFKVVSLAGERGDQEGAWTTHVLGMIVRSSDGAAAMSMLTPAAREAWMRTHRCLDARPDREPAFDGIWSGGDAALCRLQLPITCDGSRMPALIAASLAAVQSLVEPHGQRRWVPQGIERLGVFEEPPAQENWCRLTVRTINEALVANVEVHAPDGRLLVSFEGLYFNLVSGTAETVAVDHSRNVASEAAHFVANGEQGSFAQRLSQAAPANRRRVVGRLVEDLTREVLGRAASATVDPNAGFFDAGMNSLGAVMLSNRLQEVLQRSLPITLAFSYSTPGQLADYLCDDVLGLPVAASERSGPDAGASARGARVDDLSEAQLAARLACQLKQLQGGAANDS